MEMEEVNMDFKNSNTALSPVEAFLPTDVQYCRFDSCVAHCARVARLGRACSRTAFSASLGNGNADDCGRRYMEDFFSVLPKSTSGS